MKVIEDYTGIGGGSHIPELLIIHAMAEYIKVEKSFKVGDKVFNKGTYHAHKWLQMLGLSAHFLQNPDGSFIKQRSTKEICWHAKGFNAGSIGIEILVAGVYTYEEFLKKIKTDWVTPDQYKELILMSQGIIDYFKIKKIKRHSDLSPGRKYDPGSGFKWDWFKQQLTY
jgi:AmpD protein